MYFSPFLRVFLLISAKTREYLPSILLLASLLLLLASLLMLVLFLASLPLLASLLLQKSPFCCLPYVSYVPIVFADIHESNKQYSSSKSRCSCSVPAIAGVPGARC
jgi:hypothetical protein